RRDCAEDDVGRAALPARRPPRPGRGAQAVPRSHRQVRSGVDADAPRHCAALAPRASRAGGRRAGRRLSRAAAMARVTLDELNRMDPRFFAATLGDIFEHSPWIAEAACARRPFATLNALFEAMTQA